MDLDAVVLTVDGEVPALRSLPGHASTLEPKVPPTAAPEPVPGASNRLRWRILEAMSTSPSAKRRHHPSSPFKPQPERVIELFALGDRVIHDEYGLGCVVGEEKAAVTVDFGDRTVRLTSPFPKMTKL